MSDDFAKLFFATLSLLVWGATLLTLLLWWAHRRNPESEAGLFFEDISRNGVWLAFAVATFTTLGSLYLSEVMHFVPCPLCWYQRICMYPLSVALLVGGLRRDRDVYAYVLPPALIGAAFAIYHTQLQAFPKQTGRFCTGAELCKVRYIYEFHFVSIPFMSLSAFTFIIVMMLIVRAGRFDEPDDDEPDADDIADNANSTDDGGARSPSAQGVA
jgi:disulfide bond formation protein DsbB